MIEVRGVSTHEQLGKQPLIEGVVAITSAVANAARDLRLRSFALGATHHVLQGQQRRGLLRGNG